MDVGFPNVRAAEQPEEREALLKRVEDARVSTGARNCTTVLEDFMLAVLSSRVVLCRSFGVLSRLASADTELYATYYGDIEGESRLPEDNVWDRFREPVDSTLFPHYHKDIRFAALTLDGRGVNRYGQYAILLREEMIRRRTTVFEENSVVFCRRHRIALGQALPRGYRAPWEGRNLLAAAKLHSKLADCTPKSEYPEVLLTSGTGPEDDNFIEVHIFGPINRRAFERVVGPKPGNRNDAVLWQRLERQLHEVGAVLEAL
jgi:hypothetical protein